MSGIPEKEVNTKQKDKGARVRCQASGACFTIFACFLQSDLLLARGFSDLRVDDFRAPENEELVRERVIEFSWAAESLRSKRSSAHAFLSDLEIRGPLSCDLLPPGGAGRQQTVVEGSAARAAGSTTARCDPVVKLNARRAV